MKKKIWVLLMLGVTVSMAMGQGAKNPCEKLEKLRKLIKDSIGITAAQDAQIVAINDSACTKLKAVINSGADEATQKANKRKIAEQARESYKRVLTADQLKRLKAKRASLAVKKLNPERRASKKAAIMKEKLGLDDTQTQQVKAATLDQLNAVKALKERKIAGADTAELKQSARKIRLDYKSRLQSILTTEQFATWQQLQKERHKKRKLARQK
jgi:hypothetical protein